MHERGLAVRFYALPRILFALIAPSARGSAMPSDPSHMPLGDHLDELRRRLLYGLVGLVPIVVVALIFGERLLGFLLEPAQDALRRSGQSEMLQQTSPLEVFGTYMKVSLIAAAVVGSPWLLYQLWRFVAPGLYRHERRFVYFLLPLSTILTTLGLVFLFRIILPTILMYLVGFGTGIGVREVPRAPVPEGVVLPSVPVLAADPISPEVGQAWINGPLSQYRVCVFKSDTKIEVLTAPMRKETGIMQQYRVSEYVSLLLTLTVAFAAAFQAPVVLLLLGWIGVVDASFLNKYRRHAILINAVLAAILMPGDPISMVLMWVPLMALYELGGVLLRLFPAHRVAGKREDEEAARGEG